MSYIANFIKNKRTGQYEIILPDGVAKKGGMVTVTKADGTTTDVVIGKPGKAFIAKYGPNTGQSVCIAPIEKTQKGRTGRCYECGGPIEDAPHHRAMDGYCGSCAFDEFDC